MTDHSSSYSRRAAYAAAGLLALALGAASLGAQEAESLPFAAGQKALHVAVGESFGIGGLFFRSPTSAWHLEAAATVGRTETEQPDGIGGGDDRTSTTVDLQLRAGLRSMRPLGGSTLAFHTVGLLGGYGRQSSEQGTFDVESSSWNVGAFLDLGGEYLFSSRFGLGVAVGAALRYSNISTETPNTTQDGSAFSLGTTPARLTGTLYF